MNYLEFTCQFVNTKSFISVLVFNVSWRDDDCELGQELGLGIPSEKMVEVAMETEVLESLLTEAMPSVTQIQISGR